MRRWVSIVIVCTLATLLAVQPVAAGAARGPLPATNQPPIASAGLDQSVTSGTTVYLDAGGSWDPDGTIAETTWTVRAPNGTTVAPSCRHCRTPTLTPSATGRWAVTVTVTDDDGATTSDTLYVTVEAPRGPSVSVTAPSPVTRGHLVPFDISATADGAPLRAVALYRGDTKLGGTSVAGDSATARINHTFDSNGTVQIEAAAIDTDGYVNTTTATVDVVEPSALDTSGSSGSTGGGSDGEMCTIGWARDVGIDCNGDVTFDGASRGGPAGTMMFDADNDGIYKTKISTDSGPRLLNLTEKSNISKHEETINGVTVIDYDAALTDAKNTLHQENENTVSNQASRNPREPELIQSTDEPGTTSSPSGSNPPASVSAGYLPTGHSVPASVSTGEPEVATSSGPDTSSSDPATNSYEPEIDTTTANGITDTSTESETTSASGHSLTSGSGPTTTTTTDTAPEMAEPTTENSGTSYSPGPSQRGAPNMGTSYMQAMGMQDDVGPTDTSDTGRTSSATSTSDTSSDVGRDTDTSSSGDDDNDMTAMEEWCKEHGTC